MVVNGSLEITSTEKRNISSLSLLQSFIYDFNILDFLEKEVYNLQIDRSGYEALHDGKQMNCVMKKH